MYGRFFFVSLNILRKTTGNRLCVKDIRGVAYDGWIRGFTSASGKPPQNLEKVNFGEFQNLAQNKNTTIIDVREPKEILEHGSLPRSINIPLGEIETTLKDMAKNDFLKKYGHPKPDEETQIVFSCMKGSRSEKAQLIALKLGYKKTKNYMGGWTEWSEKSKE